MKIALSQAKNFINNFYKMRCRFPTYFGDKEELEKIKKLQTETLDLAFDILFSFTAQEELKEQRPDHFKMAEDFGVFMMDHEVENLGSVWLTLGDFLNFKLEEYLSIKTNQARIRERREL